MYSREFNVKRSSGIHLMVIVEYIAQVSGIVKRGKLSEEDLNKLALPGFLWEHVMTRAEKLERAFSVEAMRMHMIHRSNLIFPGEMFYCVDCDRVFKRREGREHRKQTHHKGIFSTPDAYDTDDGAYVEFKYTSMSSRRSHPKRLNTPDGIWKWLVQCMWNCYTLGTKKAKIIACHSMGKWGRALRGLPDPRPYEIAIEFTDREIYQNKKMIVNNSKSKGWTNGKAHVSSSRK